MLTIDEAIEHCEEKAKEQDKLATRYEDASGYSRSHIESLKTDEYIEIGFSKVIAFGTNSVFPSNAEIKISFPPLFGPITSHDSPVVISQEILFNKVFLLF